VYLVFPLVKLWGYGIKRHFQQYFSHIVAVSSIVGKKESTLRKRPTIKISNLKTFEHPELKQLKHTLS
jgi:hypothetical protein